MEVKFLMNLLDRTLTKKLIERFNQQDIYFHWTGFEEKLSTSLINKIKATEQATSANKRKLVINFCFNYGGMQDIFQAAQQVKKQTTLSGFAQLLLTSDLPPVDLLIRTGDEKRISNFLLFQSAYAEIIFESTL
jgi:undecaprenyl diphosphate synthase